MLRFHLLSAIRVALRPAAVKLLVATVAVGLSSSPSALFDQLVLGLAGAGGLTAAPLLFALWAATDAHLGAVRIAPALRGWHLHLPVSARGRRRSAVAALVCMQAPVLGLWLVLWTMAALSGKEARWIVLASIPCIALAGAYATLPGARATSRVVATASLLLAPAGHGWPLLVAAGGVVLAERTAGPLLPAARASRRARRNAPPASLPFRINLRAVGGGLPVMLVAALAPVAAGAMLLRNNDLSSTQAALGTRLACGLGILLTLVQVAGHLRPRRPPWGWARSLPWTGRRRVLEDAIFLATCALPPAAASLWMAPRAAAAPLALLAFGSVRAATAIRRGGGRLSSLAATDVTELTIVTLAVAVTGWAGWPLLALLPWAVARAARSEQELKVGLWIERQHDPSAGGAG